MQFILCVFDCYFLVGLVFFSLGTRQKKLHLIGHFVCVSHVRAMYATHIMSWTIESRRFRTHFCVCVCTGRIETRAMRAASIRQLALQSQTTLTVVDRLCARCCSSKMNTMCRFTPRAHVMIQSVDEQQRRGVFGNLFNFVNANRPEILLASMICISFVARRTKILGVRLRAGHASGVANQPKLIAEEQQQQKIETGKQIRHRKHTENLALSYAHSYRPRASWSPREFKRTGFVTTQHSTTLTLTLFSHMQMLSWISTNSGQFAE